MGPIRIDVQLLETETKTGRQSFLFSQLLSSLVNDNLCKKRAQGVGVEHHQESTQCNPPSPCPPMTTPSSHLHLGRDQRKTL